MSGGVDSEAMAMAFLEAGIPVRAAIGIYGPNAMNTEDVADAFLFCRRHDIPVQEIPVDLTEFFESDRHLEYGRRFSCASPQLAVHLHLLSRIKGVPVLAWNPTEIEWNARERRIKFLLPSEPHMSYLRYFALEKRPGVPFFFAYTPELIYSFWNTPQFREDLQRAHRESSAPDTPPESRFSYWLKVKKYQQGGFPVIARHRKRTGFEEAKIFFKNRFAEKNQFSEMPQVDAFDFFFRKPLEKISPYPSRTIQIVPSRFFPHPEFFPMSFPEKGRGPANQK
ncbi:MAG: hypothetical protein KF802_11620 [Bdellovibrionaceae bacterium]|nr:hypothetical protein [Pseudobdellovibrionaceae bacterium]